MIVRVEEVVHVGEEVTKESLANYISKIASVVYDREKVKNPIKRFEKLECEAYGKSPSSVFAFIPCTIPLSLRPIRGRYFGEVKEGLHKTNLRELLKEWSWSLEESLKYVDFTNYKTLRIVAPYFVFGQLSRSQTLAVVSHSNRYSESKNGYWMPEEYIKYAQERDSKVLNREELQKEWNELVVYLSPRKLEHFMKVELEIKRREVSARGKDLLELRSFCLGGYIDNEHQWQWIIKQRALDEHTQKETLEVATEMAEVLYGEAWRELATSTFFR